jgi:hypothetical protein
MRTAVVGALFAIWGLVVGWSGRYWWNRLHEPPPRQPWKATMPSYMTDEEFGAWLAQFQRPVKR